MNAALSYTRYELLRTFRNARFFIFSLGFPVVLYYVIAGGNKDVANLSGSGISAPLYFMVGLASFGTMNAVLAAGARISPERAVGWNRQLRLTPLKARAYFRAKVVTGYTMALITLAILYGAGLSLGVSLTAGRWIEMTAYLLIGLIPFVAMGVVFGHLVTPESIGPVMGGTTAFLSLLGGIWFPLGSGTLHDIAQVLPSFWLVQASHVSLGGAAWGVKGWLVEAAWTVGLTALAARAYARDTQRV
jgi:ABC-2 type transport system permease protein